MLSRLLIYGFVNGHDRKRVIDQISEELSLSLGMKIDDSVFDDQYGEREPEKGQWPFLIANRGKTRSFIYLQCGDNSDLLDYVSQIIAVCNRLPDILLIACHNVSVNTLRVLKENYPDCTIGVDIEDVVIINAESMNVWSRRVNEFYGVVDFLLLDFENDSSVSGSVGALAEKIKLVQEAKIYLPLIIAGGFDEQDVTDLVQLMKNNNQLSVLAGRALCDCHGSLDLERVSTFINRFQECWSKH